MLSTTQMFLIGLVINLFVIYSFPALSDGDKQKLFRFPKSGDEVRGMYQVIKSYTETSYWLVVLAFCSTYINFVSFCVPGSGVLAILAGPVFGPVIGFTMVHGCSITGACVCYLISMKVGAGTIKDRFPEKFGYFERQINENRHNLFWYFLFLRLAPVVPNLLINTASGLVGIPFGTYVTASLVGQIPFTLIYIKTGMMLDELTTVGGIDFKSMLGLGALALIALIPTYLTKKDANEVEAELSDQQSSA
mmetsp:Transcript_19046/g.25772  ORF Transcript_19046/g.25772 Transcript_19046/m.25772 type:complete len:249 (-) Transcript_19046:104-850(-)